MYKYLKINSRNLFYILLTIILISLIFFKKDNNHSLVEAEKNILSQFTNCYSNQSLEKSKCYKDSAKYLSNNFNLNTIFSVLEKTESHQEVFEACHSTLHFLGQYEYERINDISKALEKGNPICFAGFYHGILESYLAQKNLSNSKDSVIALRKELPTLCKKNISKNIIKNYNECLHGLGHALMYATNGELPSSLELCDTLETKTDREWCYSGAFMENSTSSTNKDHPSKYLRKDNPLYPCNTLDDKYLNMCYNLQGFYFAELANYNWPKTYDMCRQVPKLYQESCFNSIGQSQVGFSQDLNIEAQNCQNIAEIKYQNACVGGIVGALTERYNTLDRAIELCSIVNSENKQICYNRLFNIIKNRINDNKEQYNICKQIIDSDYKKTCEETFSY